MRQLNINDSFRQFQHWADEIREPYKTLIEKLIEALIRKHEDRFISLVIFGSIARGETRKDSDIDLLLIFNNRLDFQKKA